MEFKVLDIDPSPFSVVAPNTFIYCTGTAIEREDEEDDLTYVDYDNIGAVKKQLVRLKIY